MIKFCTVIAKIYSIVICKLCLNGLRCCYFITKSARLQFFFSDTVLYVCMALRYITYVTRMKFLYMLNTCFSWDLQCCLVNVFRIAIVKKLFYYNISRTVVTVLILFTEANKVFYCSSDDMHNFISCNAYDVYVLRS